MNFKPSVKELNASLKINIFPLPRLERVYEGKIMSRVLVGFDETIENRHAHGRGHGFFERSRIRDYRPCWRVDFVFVEFDPQVVRSRARSNDYTQASLKVLASNEASTNNNQSNH